ncbi:MAG TPA: ATP-grasp fold amidoligase family protein [Verrucomicrobiota bacterium]|nr:MAG: hypothetical protein BWX83_00226 [Candidatus Cloacimonetes bacterium ADurb.Bin117]HPY31740.1 ATP-grasp fold amidoligase family protein [Verrucomicrobiota bacterium]HQB18010.1 ATP-grasp fold amidoligase family protein [Verrucomicrobiota bacterium]
MASNMMNIRLHTRFRFWALPAWARALLARRSPATLQSLYFWSIRGRWPNLRQPRTFEEKLIWLNLHWRHPLKTQCADKYTLRTYVAEQGLAPLLPELLGVYDRVEQIDFDRLPARFVLKCSHGCKCNVICRDKARLDQAAARRDLNRWLRTNYSRLAGELHYATMQPRILCEEFLEDGTGEVPADYKVYCFQGKVHCTMVCIGRALDGHHAKFIYYNREWTQRLPYLQAHSMAEGDIPPPAGYEEMLAAAEHLAAPFPFVRVDFYSIQGRVVLGEMTFTPAGCVDGDLAEKATQILGGLIPLPEKYPAPA